MALTDVLAALYAIVAGLFVARSFLPVGDVFALLLLHCWDGWWQHDLFRAGGVGPRRLVVCFVVMTVHGLARGIQHDK